MNSFPRFICAGAIGLLAALSSYAQAPTELPKYDLPAALAAKLSPSDREMFTALGNLHIESAWSALSGLGYPDSFTNQVPLVQPGMTLLGRARTLELLPGRKDLDATIPHPTYLFRVIDSANPGDVLVFAMNGVTSVGAGGDVTSQRFVYRGGAGMIFDGAAHDLSLIRLYPMPIFARAGHTSALRGKLIYTRTDVPVSFAGITIMPGDILYGNGSGILAIPKDLVWKVIEKAREEDLEEGYLRDQLSKGGPLIGTYPPNPASLKGLEKWKAEHPRH